MQEPVAPLGQVTLVYWFPPPYQHDDTAAKLGFMKAPY